MLKLYIGNKNYSSWSMRPWVLLKQSDIQFDEVMVRFGGDPFTDNSSFKLAVMAVNPTGRVPVLIDDTLAVWDTLAIAEYVAEKFPEKHLWPQNVAARARSVCAEMHSGFTSLRSACPMNIEANLPDAGANIWRDNPGVRADVARIVSMWTELLAQHKGPMLFGEFSIADAYFAPVCMRLRSYALPVPANISDYIQRVCALPGVKAWLSNALAEKDFVGVD